MDYNHVNLIEVDDQAPNLGLDPAEFNLRFGRVALTGAQQRHLKNVILHVEKGLGHLPRL